MVKDTIKVINHVIPIHIKAHRRDFKFASLCIEQVQSF
jgi:hypothetical protein